MKNSKKSAFLLLAVSMLMTTFTGCSSINEKQETSLLSETEISELPVYPMRATFVYDVDDMQQAVGIADYVFVGEVISCDGIEYRDVVTMEDGMGNMKEVGSPYTTYTVNVVENLKGNLVTEEPISITKQGGVSQDQDAVYVFEDDELPVAGNTYIFLGYAQEDGSILISGPNSNILYTNISTYSVDKNSEYQEYKTAVENEIVPVERERYTSIYEDAATK